MSSVFILGRQPALGLAELESIFGAAAVRPVGSHAAVVQSDTVTFSRLGGSLKAGRVLQTLATTDWRAIQTGLQAFLSDYQTGLTPGKLQLGISVYGMTINNKKIMAAGLSLKKALRANGRSVRLIPNSESTLGSAQLLYNKLTSSLGCELLIIKDGSHTILAQTTDVQDIDAYAQRDRGRPKRDPRVGMLPPKLAQIIINLVLPASSRSTTRLEDTKSEIQPESQSEAARNGIFKSSGRKGDQNFVILDPFCGTGVVLQEALLMDCNVVGSDLEPRMIEYSAQNLKWLQEKIGHLPKVLTLEAGNATSHQWQIPFDAVASEVYLGRPFTALPTRQMLEKNRRDCDQIIRKFLQNIHSQIKPNTRLCLALPAWTTPFSNSHTPIAKFVHLPLLDSLEKLGYNRKKFVHVSNDDLIYHREGQIVGRELVIITRK